MGGSAPRKSKLKERKKKSKKRKWEGKGREGREGTGTNKKNPEDALMESALREGKGPKGHPGGRWNRPPKKIRIKREEKLEFEREEREGKGRERREGKGKRAKTLRN